MSGKAKGKKWQGLNPFLAFEPSASASAFILKFLIFFANVRFGRRIYQFCFPVKNGWHLEQISI